MLITLNFNAKIKPIENSSVTIKILWNINLPIKNLPLLRYLKSHCN